MKVAWPRLHTAQVSREVWGHAPPPGIVYARALVPRLDYTGSRLVSGQHLRLQVYKVRKCTFSLQKKRSDQNPTSPTACYGHEVELPTMTLGLLSGRGYTSTTPYSIFCSRLTQSVYVLLLRLVFQQRGALCHVRFYVSFSSLLFAGPFATSTTSELSW